MIKKLIPYILAATLVALPASAATILAPYLGGTGFSTSTSANVGKVLTIASTTPTLRYTFSTPTGSLFTTTTLAGLSATTYLFNSANNLFNIATSAPGTITFIATTTPSFTNLTVTATSTFPSGIWSSNGNVGIGTTTPAYSLVVVGTSSISNILYIDSRGYSNNLGLLSTHLSEENTDTLLDKSRSSITTVSSTLVYTLIATNGSAMWNFGGYIYPQSMGSASTTLTGGTNASPVINYVYFELVGGVPTLKTATTEPTGNHIDVATFLVGAVSGSTSTIYGYNRNRSEIDSFVSRSIERTEESGTLYKNGFLPVVNATSLIVSASTITPGYFFNGIFKMFVENQLTASTTATSSYYFIKNGSYVTSSKLSDLEFYSDGSAVGGTDRANIVWGIVPTTPTSGGVSSTIAKLVAVLQTKPSTAYNSDVNAIQDLYDATNYYPPNDELRKVFVPVARTVLRQSTHQFVPFSTGLYYKDLRGKITSGGGASPSVDFSGLVPYVGATGDVNLGVYGLSVGAVTSTQLAISGIGSGNCLQTTTNGLVIGSGAACGSGTGGGTTTTINGLSTSAYTFVGSGITIATSGPGTVTFTSTATAGNVTSTQTRVIENPNNSEDDFFWYFPEAATATRVTAVNKTNTDTVTFNLVFDSSRTTVTSTASKIFSSYQTVTATTTPTTIAISSSSIPAGSVMRLSTTNGSSTQFTVALSFQQPGGPAGANGATGATGATGPAGANGTSTNRSIQWSESDTTSTSKWTVPIFTFTATSTIDKVYVSSRDAANMFDWNLLYSTDPTVATSSMFKVFSATQTTTSTPTKAKSLSSFASSTPGNDQTLTLYSENASTTLTSITIWYHEQ